MANRESELNGSFKIRDNGYDSVRFFATLYILLHHFYTTCNENKFPLHNAVKMIILRFRMGGVGVGLFFILSGALLWKGSMKEFPVKKFYKKRFLRIYIPFWIGTAMVLPIVYLETKNILQYFINAGVGNIISLLGLNYTTGVWNKFNITPGPTLVGEWFTAVIIILYSLFPLLHWLFRHHRIITTIFITIVFTANLHFEILTYQGGFFSITNGLMYFWLGMLFEEYKSRVSNYACVVTWPIIVLLLYINPRSIFGVTYLPYFFLSIATFLYVYYLRVNGQFSQYVCRYNYEVYLLHHRIYLICMPLLLSQKSNQLQISICFVILTFLVFILAEKLQIASKWVEKSITKIT